MKRKLFLLVFSLVSLVGLLIYRIYLLGNCIESFNGFFKPDCFVHGWILTILLIAFAVLTGIFVYTDKNFPGSHRRSSRVLAVADLLYGLFVIAYAVTKINSLEDVWASLEFLLLLCLGGFMAYHSYCMFKVKKVSAFISVLPLLYFVFELCYEFINSFGLIKSSEVILKIIALIFCTLFFQTYTRYVSRVTFRKIRKHTLFTGVCAVVFSVVAYVSDLIASEIFEDVTVRISSDDAIFMAFTAVYIGIFLYSSFSKKVLYRIYGERKTEEFVSETIEL